MKLTRYMTIIKYLFLSASSFVLSFPTLAFAQTQDLVTQVSNAGRLEPIPTTGISPTLDYSLRLNSSCVITSPLIRLRDVATPLGPPSTWWERAGGVVVGMMPIDGGEMEIERERLTIAMNQEASIPPIDWTGPKTVRVRMVASSVRPDKAITATDQNRPVTAVMVEMQNRVSSNNETSGSVATVSAKIPVSPELPALSAQDSDRIVRLIQFAIDRVDLSLRDSYDIEIDPEQSSLRSLADVRRVDRIAFVDQPIEGAISARVFGVTSRNEVDQLIEVKFISRPMVVVPRDSLRRGQIISAADLVLMPAPRGFPVDSAITNIDDAVDMQVVNVLQKDRPITPSSITRPVLIERGDLVEVHVVGGGVTVATSARSLSKGAEGDLIAVETIEPRKKIIARVARSGLVEVFTRPPRVR
jgi:flagella basal body P-ring formation protein FlgA